MMIFENTSIEGLKIVKLSELPDNRGLFLKLYNHEIYKENGINGKIEEIYLSQSSRSVIRGLHYQKPPFAHSKLIFCLSGSIFDVALDIRKDSPTYGHHFSIHLESKSNIGLYIPVGFAHGFQSLKDNSTVINGCSKVYSAEYEKGISYDSCGIKWPLDKPILSDKDKNQLSLSEITKDF